MTARRGGIAAGDSPDGELKETERLGVHQSRVEGRSVGVVVDNVHRDAENMS